MNYNFELNSFEHVMRTLRATAVASLVLAAASVEARSYLGQDTTPAKQQSDRIRIPNRPDKPLFQGEQGKQKTEIHFNPTSGIVTMKLLVQDPNGYFVPNIRRDNFAVYENGVRQQNVQVGVEHAPVSLALMMEYGGHYPALNKEFFQEILRAGHQVLDVVGPDDKLAVWTYGDTMRQQIDFTQDRQARETLVLGLQPPGVSETNLYDALISASERLHRVAGRKGIILLSSGIDTFSKATLEDALKAVRNSNTPIYVISMMPTLDDVVQLHGLANTMRKIDSKRAAKELMEIAQDSGGRFYAPSDTVDLSGTYDDIIENLKVRYVITYKSSTHASVSSPRTVRIELVNPNTGGPLEIVDANRRSVPAKVIIQDSYRPVE